MKLTDAGLGRPTQADLRRAVSCAYYALFHRLALECADRLVGTKGAGRSTPAWRQTYRALQHRRVKDVCESENSRFKRVFARFPNTIKEFANAFVTLQKKRHAADYDPLCPPLVRSEVEASILTAENAIAKFNSSDVKDRRAFAIFVLLDLRP